MEIIVRKPNESERAEMAAEPIWEKEVSAFPWEYDMNETCLLIEGRVTVTPHGGEAVSFGAGDLVTFPKGMKCDWDITQPVRKHYKFF